MREFHSVLDKLKGIGIDVSQYRIPDSEVKPQVSSSIVVLDGGSGSSSSSSSRVRYSEEKYVDKPFILLKLDSILGYLESRLGGPGRIGFRTPDNQ